MRIASLTVMIDSGNIPSKLKFKLHKEYGNSLSIRLGQWHLVVSFNYRKKF